MQFGMKAHKDRLQQVAAEKCVRRNASQSSALTETKFKCNNCKGDCHFHVGLSATSGASRWNLPQGIFSCSWHSLDVMVTLNAYERPRDK